MVQYDALSAPVRIPLMQIQLEICKKDECTSALRLVPLFAYHSISAGYQFLAAAHVVSSADRPRYNVVE